MTVPLAHRNSMRFLKLRQATTNAGCVVDARRDVPSILRRIGTESITYSRKWYVGFMVLVGPGHPIGGAREPRRSGTLCSPKERHSGDRERSSRYAMLVVRLGAPGPQETIDEMT